MESLIQYLEGYGPKPKYAQVASDGNWENAIRADFANNFSFEASKLGEVSSSVAGELFYELNDGRAVFFGIRYSDFLQAASSPEEFFKGFSLSLEAVKASILREALVELGQRLNNDALTFISPSFNYVELGVEGYWKSMGSKVLRKAGDQALTTEAVKNLLVDNQSLLCNDKNHIALEFAVSRPECWFGIQVSKESDGQYTTNPELLVALANMI